MTPKELKYLFYGIYFSVQGLFLFCALAFCCHKLRQTKDANWWNGIALFALLKTMNSFCFLYNWGIFIDPDGA